MFKSFKQWNTSNHVIYIIFHSILTAILEFIIFINKTDDINKKAVLQSREMQYCHVFFWFQVVRLVAKYGSVTDIVS